MNALILAAGRGRRLWPYTSKRPKCLLSLGPQSILEHQLDRLARTGIRRVTVVAGFGLQAVRRHIDAVAPANIQVRVVYNPFHDAADNLISLWAARAYMDDDVLVLNGDNAFHPDLLRILVSAPVAPCQLLVQRRAEYVEDDMKVTLDGHRLRCIGKSLPAEAIDAASVGLMRFRGTGADALRSVLEDAVRDESALHSYYLDCVQRLADAGLTVDCLDVGNLPWADIDTPADLLAVRRQVARFDDAPVLGDHALGEGGLAAPVVAPTSVSEAP